MFHIKLISIVGTISAVLGLTGGCEINSIPPQSNYNNISRQVKQKTKRFERKYQEHSVNNSYTPSKARANSVLTNSVQSQLNIKHRLIRYNGAGAFIINNNRNNLTISRAGAPYAVNKKDKQGRPWLGNALLTKAIRQYANREYTGNGRTEFKPAGFKQTYLGGRWSHAYDRGHILAYSLVGHARHFDASESNSSNIATQTMWANEANQGNSTGQNYFETLVRKAVDRNEKVRYRVTDIYNSKSDIVPSGAHIEAKGTDGLSINVFVPNVQYNMVVNYRTGVVTPEVK